MTPPRREGFSNAFALGEWCRTETPAYSGFAPSSLASSSITTSF